VKTPEPDPRRGLARALAETDLECQSAEHDYRKLLQDGAQHMQSRYGAQHLEAHPEDLDHWSWHMEAMAQAREDGGIGEIPDLPFTPSLPPGPVGQTTG
jgi:hypothetical protein